jgi:hypothetical protein
MQGHSMLTIVTFFALALSGLSWLLFVVITFLHDLPTLGRLIKHAQDDPAAAPRSLANGERLLEGAGVLAGAFRRAGAGPTAAAMSLVCLVVAAITAGVEKF